MTALSSILMVAATAAALASGQAAAQGQPLRLIVPYLPGPGVDLISYGLDAAVADAAPADRCRQSPGAGSVIGV